MQLILHNGAIGVLSTRHRDSEYVHYQYVFLPGEPEPSAAKSSIVLQETEHRGDELHSFRLFIL